MADFGLADHELWNFLNNISQQLESLLNYDQQHHQVDLGVDQSDRGQESNNLSAAKSSARTEAVSVFKSRSHYDQDFRWPDTTIHHQQDQGQEFIYPSSTNTTQQVESDTQIHNSYYQNEAYYFYQQQQQLHNQVQRDVQVYQYQPITINDTTVTSSQQSQSAELIYQSKPAYNCGYCEWLAHASASSQTNFSQLNPSQFYTYFNNINDK